MEFKRLEQEWTFIASIPIGYKPCYRDKTMIKSNDWFVSFRRQLKGETGHIGVLYVEQLINDTIKFIGGISVEEKDYYLGKIRDFLFEGDIGLNNLVKTYMLDRQDTVVKGYASLVDKVEKIIIEIDEFLKA